MPRTLCKTCDTRVEMGYNGTCLTCNPLIKCCHRCGCTFQTKWPQQVYCDGCRGKRSYSSTVDEYIGNVNACSLCDVVWSSAKKRGTDKQGGVEYDRFKCACGAWHYRYC